MQCEHKFKFDLPEGCPDPDAQEMTIVLYRIIQGEQLSEEDFVPYAKINDQNPTFKAYCKSFGVSFYHSREAIEAAVSRLKKKDKLGCYVALILLTPCLGKAKFDVPKRGHYCLWLYDDFSIDEVNVLDVFPIV